MLLKSEQQRLYAMMPEGSRCFVRVCDHDAALWVSDLPRRMADVTETEKRLKAEGFAVRLDETNRLWYVDWTAERWQELINGLSEEMPAFPADETYHEAYALCRLYLRHPTVLEEAHIPAMRKVLKLAQTKPEQRLRSIRFLQEEAACRLRTGKTVAHAAGRILAAWLNETNNGKEKQP